MEDSPSLESTVDAKKMVNVEASKILARKERSSERLGRKIASNQFFIMLSNGVGHLLFGLEFYKHC